MCIALESVGNDLPRRAGGRSYSLLLGRKLSGEHSGFVCQVLGEHQILCADCRVRLPDETLRRVVLLTCVGIEASGIDAIQVRRRARQRRAAYSSAAVMSSGSRSG